MTTALEDRGRIFVVGSSGAGKSTLAKALAEWLGRTRVDLDQDAFLPELLAFIATYPDSDAPTGRPAHAALFDTFVGTREKHTERPALADWCSRSRCLLPGPAIV